MGQEKEYDALIDKGARMARELDDVIIDGLNRYKANPNDEFLKNLIPYLAGLKLDILRQNVDAISLLASDEDKDILLDSARRSLANAQNEAYQISDEVATLVEQKVQDDYTPSL